MKKFLSLILCLVLSLTLCINAFAAPSTATGSSSNTLTSTTANGVTITLSFTTDDSGNTVITQKNNNVLTAKCVAEKATSQVVTTTYANGKESKSTISVKPNQTLNNPSSLVTSMAGPVYGYLTYQDLPLGKHTIRVMPSSYIVHSQYDVYGIYTNLATLAGIIVTVLSIPVGLASATVAWILWVCGVSATVGSLALPHRIIAADKFNVRYNSYDQLNASHTNYIAGSKYTITASGTYLNKVYYEGNYYDPSLYYAHNRELAINIYQVLFPYSPFSLVSWT